MSFVNNFEYINKSAKGAKRQLWNLKEYEHGKEWKEWRTKDRNVKEKNPNKTYAMCKGIKSIGQLIVATQTNAR